MPISIVCPSCSGKLKVPDQFAGRKVKCPKCGGAVPTDDVAPVSEAIVESAKVGKQTIRPQRRAVQEAIQPADDGFKLQESDSPPDEEPVEQPKKKKKKKKRKERPSGGLPVWAIWLAVLGGFMMLASIAAAWAIHAGHGLLVLEWGVYLVVMLPVSTVILIISMIISSQLAGGIDFGDVREVIPKAVGLLLLVNVIGLIPYGGWVTFPIWLFGLMFLFHLDLWESRLLITINWLLNFWAGILVWMIVVAILVSADSAASSLGGGDSNPVPARSELSKEQESALQAIDALGGAYDFDEDSRKPVIIHVSLADTAATDSTVASLKRLPKLRSLELAGTRITDAGLADIKELKELEALDLSRTRITDTGLGHLKELKRLKFLSLGGTQVSNAGVQALQQVLPQVRINR